MIRKYKMSEEEILKIWDDFHAKHPDGFMTKESFLDTKEVFSINEWWQRDADEIYSPLSIFLTRSGIKYMCCVKQFV